MSCEFYYLNLIEVVSVGILLVLYFLSLLLSLFICINCSHSWLYQCGHFFFDRNQCGHLDKVYVFLYHENVFWRACAEYTLWLYVLSVLWRLLWVAGSEEKNSTRSHASYQTSTLIDTWYAWCWNWHCWIIRVLFWKYWVMLKHSWIFFLSIACHVPCGVWVFLVFTVAFWNCGCIDQIFLFILSVLWKK